MPVVRQMHASRVTTSESAFTHFWCSKEVGECYTLAAETVARLYNCFALALSCRTSLYSWKLHPWADFSALNAGPCLQSLPVCAAESRNWHTCPARRCRRK